MEGEGRKENIYSFICLYVRISFILLLFSFLGDFFAMCNSDCGCPGALPRQPIQSRLLRNLGPGWLSAASAEFSPARDTSSSPSPSTHSARARGPSEAEPDSRDAGVVREANPSSLPPTDAGMRSGWLARRGGRRTPRARRGGPVHTRPSGMRGARAGA